MCLTYSHEWGEEMEERFQLQVVSHLENPKCVDGIHMFNSIQFYLHLFESGMSVGAFQKACWDWDLLHIRMETRPRLKLLM